VTDSVRQQVATLKANRDRPILLGELDEALIGYSLANVTLERVAIYDAAKVRATLRAKGLTGPGEVEGYIENQLLRRYFGKASPVLVELAP